MSISLPKCLVLSVSLAMPTGLALVGIATLSPTSALACDPNQFPYPNCSGLKKINQPSSHRPRRNRINPTTASPIQDTVCETVCMLEGSGEVKIDSPTPAQSSRDARAKRRQNSIETTSSDR